MSLVPYSRTFAGRATRAIPKAGLGKYVTAGLGLAGTYAAYDQMTKKQELSPNEITRREAIAAERARQEQLEKLIDVKITKSIGNEGQLYENLYTDLISIPVAEIELPPGINMQIEAYALDRMRKEGEEAANLKRIAEGLKPEPVAELTPIRSINDVMTIIDNYISYLNNQRSTLGRVFGRSYPKSEFNPAVLRQKISYKQTNAAAAKSAAELRGGRRKRTRRRRTHRRSRSNRNRK